MSFFTNMQKWFGFSYEDEVTELPDFSSELQNSDPEMQFNESQRQFIREILDTSVKEYLKELVDAQAQKGASGHMEDNGRNKKLLAEANEKIKTLEESVAKESEKALSNERQKRHLVTQLNDLKSKVDALEAEREQYDLENKALQNRLRVAEVHRSNHEAEISSLKSQLEAGRDEADSLNEVQAKMDEVLKDIEEARIERDKAIVETKRLEELHATALKEAEEAIIARDNAFRQIEELTSRLEEAIKAKGTAENTRDKAIAEAEELRMLLKVKEVPVQEAAPHAANAGVTDTKDSKTESAEDLEQPILPSSEVAYDFVSFDEEKPQINLKSRKKTEKKKKEKRDTEDLLNDTDWLVEAGKDFENPDRIVPPSQQNNTDQDDFGPHQLSLW